MALFPILADKAQITTAAPVVTDAYARGLLLVADGLAVRGASSGGAQFSNGLLLTPLGQVVFVDATAGLPAGTQFVNGLPLAPTGELCVSSGAMANYSSGLPFAANGALAAVFA